MSTTLKRKPNGKKTTNAKSFSGSTRRSCPRGNSKTHTNASTFLWSPLGARNSNFILGLHNLFFKLTSWTCVKNVYIARARARDPPTAARARDPPTGSPSGIYGFPLRESIGSHCGNVYFIREYMVPFGNLWVPLRESAGSPAGFYWSPFGNLWAPLRESMGSPAGTYGLQCGNLWVPLRESMGSASGIYGFLFGNLWVHLRESIFPSRIYGSLLESMGSESRPVRESMGSPAGIYISLERIYGSLRVSMGSPSGIDGFPFGNI